MKSKTQYRCQSCNYVSPKWMGRCPQCGEWSSLVEEAPEAVAAKGKSSELANLREEFKNSRKKKLDQAGPYSAPSPRENSHWEALGAKSDENGEATPQHLVRLDTGIREVNRVLGGGLVPDSFTLLGGDPGIGKSTLILQMAHGLKEAKVLYVSGEESVYQIRSRAHRLGVESEDRIFLSAETSLEKVFASVKEIGPDVLMVDSLQTFASQTLESPPGSVSQVREISAKLMTLAKSAGIAVILVGHVTKEGSIAGPKVVEHMVDTVLYFEGEGAEQYRLLRAIKNRFGSAKELGVFEMAEGGLKEVENPSSLFLGQRDQAVEGTAVGTSLEGSRPILVELQSLVSPSNLAMPRRTTVGMDHSRVVLLAAILEKHLGLPLAERDVFFNVAGGLKITEPACDLPAAAAMYSSFLGTPMPQDWIWMGEIGLTGEVRRVNFPEVRLEEAKKLGFARAILPASAMDRVKGIRGVEVRPINRVQELASLLGSNLEAERDEFLGDVSPLDC
jgi:DNA repair protein RadA/Sms